MKERGGMEDEGFSELKKPFGMREAKDDEREVSLRLANPAREAKSVSVSGTLFFLNAAADPASIVTVKPREQLNQALEHPALKEAKVKLIFKKLADKEVEYSLSDPAKKVAAVELYDAEGKPIESNGWSRYGFGATKTCSIHVDQLPQAFEARVQLVTEKSVIKLPWKLDKVTLP
jgi:hypothetical protein